MGLSDIDFNQALRDAKVIGCAYGFCSVPGMPQPIPLITLVGSNREAFARAYKHFAHWGCEEDGDVVDVDLLLRSDGSYDLWIGPEVRRMLYRTIPKADLFEVMSLNLSWIKHIDTTHQMVRDLKKHCESGLRAIAIGAALGDPSNRRSTDLRDVAEWKNIVKFGLQIIDESEHPDDRRFHIAVKQRSPKKDKMRAGQHATPAEICQRRTKTLDIAFPVSRERVRRSGLASEVRALPGFRDVTETQVTQAAINLMLSDELVPSDHHYVRIGGDYRKKVWTRIAAHSEQADGRSSPSNYAPLLVGRQIELDVRTLLNRVGLKTKGSSLAQAQEVLLQMGYVND